MGAFLDVGMIFLAQYAHLIQTRQTIPRDNTYVADLSSAYEVWHSIPMQVELGADLFLYAVVHFISPCFVEPTWQIFTTYFIQRGIVRTHPELQDYYAESALTHFEPFNLRRYAMILGNICLASLVFFFPPGTILPMFGMLLIFCILIYLFDHIRCLRYVPGFNYCTSDTDRIAQAMCSIPCGIMAAASVHRFNVYMGIDDVGVSFAMPLRGYTYGGNQEGNRSQRRRLMCN